MHAWVDGRLLEDPTQPAIGVTDHGFTVGDAVFEAVKVVDGTPFALTRHLARLERSASGLGLPAPDLAGVRRGVDAVLEQEHLPLGRLRITWTAGPAPMGSGRGPGEGTLVVAAGALDPAPDATEVVTVPWPRNERSAVVGLKTTSYAENVVALARAAEHGASEALFANLAGDVCEGTGSNVLYAVDGVLVTPTLASGCLAGVTRALALEWLAEDGVPVREQDRPLADLLAADEVALLSTTRDVQAVSRLDGRELDAPGPLVRQAQESWARHAALHPDP